MFLPNPNSMTLSSPMVEIPHNNMIIPITNKTLDASFLNQTNMDVPNNASSFIPNNNIEEITSASQSLNLYFDSSNSDDIEKSTDKKVIPPFSPNTILFVGMGVLVLLIVLK